MAADKPAIRPPPAPARAGALSLSPDLRLCRARPSSQSLEELVRVLARRRSKDVSVVRTLGLARFRNQEAVRGNSWVAARIMVVRSAAALEAARVRQYAHIGLASYLSAEAVTGYSSFAAQAVRLHPNFVQTLLEHSEGPLRSAGHLGKDEHLVCTKGSVRYVASDDPPGRLHSEVEVTGIDPGLEEMMQAMGLEVAPGSDNHTDSDKRFQSFSGEGITTVVHPDRLDQNDTFRVILPLAGKQFLAVNFPTAAGGYRWAPARLVSSPPSLRQFAAPRGLRWDVAPFCSYV